MSGKVWSVLSNVQYPELSTIYQGIAHEVDAPDLIGPLWDKQGLTDSSGQPPFRPPSDIQSHLYINPVDSLVIPHKPVIP